VEGPQAIDGTWSFEPAVEGTTVTFVAAGELRAAMRLVEPLIKRVAGSPVRSQSPKPKA
jgi:hypothetical protein